MSSQVRYRDEKAGRIRDVTLVYPHEADIDLNRISVLSPVVAALIGLSVGQTIDFQTPDRERRLLADGRRRFDQAKRHRREGSFTVSNIDLN